MMVWIVVEGFSYEGIQDVDSVWQTQKKAEERLLALEALRKPDDAAWWKIIPRTVGF
jgi:hypothetical protein